ncbi:hypothetical protein L596_024384 [Steinernema carpocapsae]|uniref:SprT-like domain-containing protein n=1 Tax=Steinernema carpocapsae TaxID=34508 RepID=A0A4U5MGM1_STECR|nr:hypothetical protein L596_024384 [Steinernema carpocapsae]
MSGLEKRPLRRVAFDDSDDSLGDLNQGLDQLKIDENPNESSASTESEGERTEDGESEQDGDDEGGSDEEFEESENYNEYHLDSFCVDDSDGREEESDCEESDNEESTDDDVEREADSRVQPVLAPSRTQPRRRCKESFLGMGTQALPKSTPIKDKSLTLNTSMNSSQAEENRLLRELYPELHDKSGRPTVDLETNSGESTQQPNSTDTDNSGEEEYEKYIRRIKKDDEKRQAKEAGDDYVFDDSSFIVNDEEISEDSSVESAIEFSDGEEVSDHEDKENEWDQEKRKEKKQKISDEERFLLGLSESYEGRRPSACARYIGKKLRKPDRANLCSELFQIYNRSCFDGQLPADLDISWNSRMLTTAGFAKCRKEKDGTRSARVELAPKVCTTADRIRDTLLHELCHVAVYLLDQQDNEKHGSFWKQWAYRCHKTFRLLPLISRCHNYKIEKKYVYECKMCNNRFYRHTKSFDTTKKVCGICYGRFELLQPSDQDSRPLTKFAEFVKNHYVAEKKSGRGHREILASLSERYKKLKTDDGAPSLANNDDENEDNLHRSKEESTPLAPTEPLDALHSD